MTDQDPKEKARVVAEKTRLISQADAARLAEVTPQRITQLITDGALTPIKIGDRVYLWKHAVERWRERTKCADGYKQHVFGSDEERCRNCGFIKTEGRRSTQC